MSDAVLTVRNLTVAYRDRTIVDALSIDVAAGRCLALIGESGAGKSQAALALLGLPGAGARISGEARLRGEDLLGENAARLRGRRIAMIFQDPSTSLTPHLRVGEQIAESLVVHRGATRREAWRVAARLLEQVQVNDVPRRLRQYPHELSGGLRQRVMIASALACDPALLIADEPTTALDVSVQAQLLKLLRSLVDQRQLALVVITHDMGVVAALADDVAVMRAGRIVERGPVARVLTEPAHDYARALLAATPRLDAPIPARGIVRPSKDADALQVHDLTVRYPAPFRRAAVCAVDEVSLRVAPGEALGVVGESGCGKTTLVRAVLRLQPIDRGRIVWMGREVQALEGEALRRLRADVQLVFQDPVASLDPTQSVADMVDEPLRALRPDLDATARAARVRTQLEDVGLDAQNLTRRAHELSVGQCQRVAIARAMILEPALLVCDEAVSSLDVPIQAQILALLGDLKQRHGTSIVFVSHNLAVVRQLCERVLVMYRGRIVECGPGERVFGEPRHPYTRLLLDSVPRMDPARERQRLEALPFAGDASVADAPGGCVFRVRCAHAVSTCASASPGPESAGAAHEVACLRWREITNPR